MYMCVRGINFASFLPFIYWILESLRQCSIFFYFKTQKIKKNCQRLHIIIVKTGGLHLLIVKTVGSHFLILKTGGLHILIVKTLGLHLLIVKTGGLHILIVKTGGLHILIVKTIGLHFLIDLHINTLRKISDNLLVIKHSGSSLKYCFNKSTTSYACRSSKLIVSENINIKYFIVLYTVFLCYF